MIRASNFVLAITLFTALKTAAASPIPNDKFDSIIQGLNIAGIENLQGYCAHSNGWVSNALSSAFDSLKQGGEMCAGKLRIENHRRLPYECPLTGTVDRSGTQPVLKVTILNAFYVEKLDFLTTTDADFQKVTAVELDLWKTKPVNHGNIPDPIIENELVMDAPYICKLPDAAAK